MLKPVLDVKEPVTLIGGSQIVQASLNNCLIRAPQLAAADGGANHLLDRGLAPRAVIGDLDSISDAARVAFADRLHHVAEQDSTDLEKALARIRAPLILGLGFLDGRLDHTLAALRALAQAGDRAVLLLGAEDVCWMARPGRQVLRVAVGLRFAAMPLGGARISTRGLRWDMQDQPLAPAGFISSSNAIAAEEVTIDATGPVLLTLPVGQLDAAIAAVHAG